MPRLDEAGLDRLLTPHGEREPVDDRHHAGGGLTPNPSWGTGTLATLVPSATKAELLTPHGEREQTARGAEAYELLNS